MLARSPSNVFAIPRYGTSRTENVMSSRKAPICSPDWMKIAEVAARLDVTYAAVHRRIKDKTLGMRVIKFGSEWRVNRADFERRYGDDGTAVIAA